jgi:uncharacterized RDD family membrane protein YckC
MQKLVKRAIALLIDTVIVGILASIIGGLLSVVGLEITIAFVIVDAIFSGLYQGIFLGVLNSQTPGKQIMGIRVVSKSGGKVSFVQGFLRGVGYILNRFFFIGWLMTIFLGNGIHEIISGTKVVD